MAFNNVRRLPLGGGLTVIVGDFTSTLGAGSQTYAVSGGRVVGVIVNPQVSTEPVEGNPNLFSTSVSGQITTITLYSNAAVTAGTFMVFVDSGG